ncbi:hypothetical protein CCZ01_07270 [Helicobacter monodelphidis]|uniref:hypothetical protein n=1 Tax=Helicobacter sp. 15-1451 TaxID=2004995 RepID=UPI000DCC4A57|nr:hypothetical protein [Helicobacter sp. 15-1451]RAX57136.1 hypothetical protein CCZ01_07270 [Helicobacter sp. 15-1451]
MRLFFIIILLLQFIWAFDFSPSKQGKSFAALNVGYTHVFTQSKTTDAINPFNPYKNDRGAAYFAVKRGLAVGDSQNLLLFFYLDGSAGANHRKGLYSVSGGIGSGYRLWNGRIIPSISVGYEGMNIAIPYFTTEQYNLYSVVGNGGIFIDIAHGFGLELGYRRAFNQIGKNIEQVKFYNDRFTISFAFYDFTL